MANIIIIGSGPAGISAALYTKRAGIDTTIITKGSGSLLKAESIENYYGFAEPVTGEELEKAGIFIDTIRGPYGGYVLNQYVHIPRRKR